MCIRDREERRDQVLPWRSAKELNKINKKDNVVICGDLNARTCNQTIPEVVGTFGKQTFNDNG